MVTIELNQKTHFDLIEMMTRFKHDWYNFIETYDIEMTRDPTNSYLHEDRTKSMYLMCKENLEICDRIISELKGEKQNE